MVPDSRLLGLLEWVMVRRSLRPEIGRTLDAGYVRGADCRYLATALCLAPAGIGDLARAQPHRVATP